MNNLSWFLYLADVLPSIAAAIRIVSVMFAVGVASVWGIWMMAFKDSFGDAETPPPSGKFAKILAACAAMLTLTAAIPSKTTIYLIAGSEAGEAVAMSETGQEILDDIQTIIKQQIKAAQ